MKLRTQVVLAGTWAALLLTAAAERSPAANHVASAFIVANDNGGWSWFEDERAIVDPVANKLLVGSIANGAGVGGAARHGDVELSTVDLTTGATARFLLKDAFEADDHNSPALYQRTDGRYVAMYATHGNESVSRWRVSTNPNDISAWSAETTVSALAGATYSNLHYLPNDNGGAGRLYDFVRSVGYDPNVLVSNDQGLTWSYGGRLLNEGGDSDRPYLRYFSDGTRIQLQSTNRHPRDFNNSIYAGYVQDGKLYNSAGAVVDANIFDATAVAPSALSLVFAANTVVNGASMQRAWTIDVGIDLQGNPVGVFQARANGSNLDHRYFYSRWNPDTSQWDVNFMGYAGSYLYSAEDDYTGLMAIDPRDVNTVYVSSEVHPATRALLYGADGQVHHELFRGQTTDNGVTWKWTPVTFNSTQDNIRPLVPKWDAANTALVWMRGAYNTYVNYNTQAAVLLNPALVEPTLALAVDFGATGQLVQSGFSAFTRDLNPPGVEQTELFSSPLAIGGGQVSVTVGGGDVQFRDRGDDVAGPLGDLAEDFVFNAGTLTLTLGNLQAGDYQIVLHAHDRDAAQGAYRILAAGSLQGQLTQSSGVSPAIGTASSRIQVHVPGSGSVTLSLESLAAGNVVLNGFELYSAAAYAGTAPPPPVDLNGDGLLDFADYQQFLSGLHTNLTGLSAEDAYKKGDLNGDLRNNFVDFQLFRQAYVSWNGEAAFAALLVAPEPGGAALATAAMMALGASRRAKRSSESITNPCLAPCPCGGADQTSPRSAAAP
jgi:hypothetical protein